MINKILLFIKEKEIFKKKYTKAILIIISVYIAIKLIFLLSLFVFPLPDILTENYSQTYYYRDGSIAWIDMNDSEQYRTYTKLKEISPYIVKGIKEYEDKFFYFHPGFNPVSIARAVLINLKSGKIVSGGSTITMQLARLSEPKDRTVINKFLELLRAMQLETRYTKRKILELYLNLIPMGGNIQGIGAASFFYFNRTPFKLSFAESCLLIGISNSPVKNRPDKYANNAKIQRKKVARKIHKKFKILKSELINILAGDVPTERFWFENNIIPLIFRLKKLPYKKTRFLTIDKDLQELSLTMLKNKMNILECLNGSVIVVDNKTMEVLVYIGSPFYELAHNSVKFNACNIHRSPGSTLKPFIYARAMEEGIITEKRKLFDVPEDFYGYKPKNFSNKYDGIVSTDEALIRSLNIPAVYLSEKLGGLGVKYIFKKAGFGEKYRDIEDTDLSVALGSYLMSLEEMVELYSALANKGIINNLIYLKSDKCNINDGYRILSEESTFIISEILSNVYRPDLPISWEFTKDKPRVAFKTGTSYGFVDSWAIGYTPRYTIGVWIGKLDNKFTKILTGINAAAPVLLNIFDELERLNDEWFKKPDGVAKRKVCAVSGMVPGNFCNELVEEYYIPKYSDNSVCDVHKRIIVEKGTDKAVSIDDIVASKEYEEKIIEVWDEKIEYYLKKMGKKNLSFSQGNLKDVFIDDTLKISSPNKNIKYVINLDKDLEYQKIPLLAYEYPDSSFFYWYANGNYIGKIKSDEYFYHCPKDKNIIYTVIDEKGRTGRVEIKVDFMKK